MAHGENPMKNPVVAAQVTADPERRRKISEAKLQHWQDPVYRERMAAQLFSSTNNPMHDPETRAQMAEGVSKASKRSWKDPACRERHLRWSRSPAGRAHAIRAGAAAAETLRTPELRERRSQISKRVWRDPAHRALIAQKRRTFLAENPEAKEAFIRAPRAGTVKFPTAPERKVIELVEEWGLPFRYVGDGTFWLSTPSGAHLNPDFIITSGVAGRTRMAVLVDGGYWHPSEQVAEENARYASVNWSILRITDTDLKTPARVLERLRSFAGSACSESGKSMIGCPSAT
jgi:hypothetical protein